MILDISTPHKPTKHFILYQVLNRGQNGNDSRTSYRRLVVLQYGEKYITYSYV